MNAALLAAALLAAAVSAPETATAPSSAGGSRKPEAGSPAAPASAPEAATAAEVAAALAADPALSAPASLPPVTARMYNVSGRLEVWPAFSFSVGDAFFRSALLGVRVAQHLDERWSIYGHAFGGASLAAAPVSLCGAGSCDAPASGQLNSTPGDLQAAFGAGVAFRPVYGKLSLLGEKTLHFDLELALGPELLRERIAPDLASQPAGRWDVGGRVSLSQRVFVSDRWSIRVGASEIVYGARVRDSLEISRKLMVEGGVSFLFGGR